MKTEEKVSSNPEVNEFGSIMMKQETTISFVMPCFNDGDSVEKAVASILDQDLPGIEMIVVNDGSDQDTRQALDRIHAKYPQVNLIHFEKNRGACVARNEGAKVATGKYLSFLPADAILYPGMARIWYETLEEFPEYDFLYGGYRFIDEKGEALPNSDYFFQSFEPYLLESSHLSPCFLLPLKPPARFQLKFR